MTLETRSFFLGIATVAGLLVVGFGGGILMGSVLTGDNSTPNKIERQAAAKTEQPIRADIKPVVPEVKPVPAVEAKPAVAAEAKPVVLAEPPPAAVAAPQPVTQAQAAPSQPAVQPDPKAAAAPQLGPEKPVALTQPPADEQVRPLSRREEARIRKEQRRAEQAQRREERRKLAAERREREMERREAAKAERMARQDFDDDDDERAIVREHRPRAPDLPFFRIFGAN
jgi:hypothetical protein